MTTRSISQIFDQYQKARVAFVQTIADLAVRPQNVEILMDAKVLGMNDAFVKIATRTEILLRAPQAANMRHVHANTTVRPYRRW